MLVLTRKAQEEIMIGDNIVVSIVKISGGKIKLGITAPPEISIKREEDPQKFDRQARERVAREAKGTAIKVVGHTISKQAAQTAVI